MPQTLLTAKGATVEYSLGKIANWWMEEFVVHGRGGATGKPVVHGPEMEDFVYYCYALDQDENINMHDSAFYSRPKGADKSGLGARFALFEAIGPNRFAGLAKGGEVYELLGHKYIYDPGEPMGKRIINPQIRIMATEEGQTGNVFDSVYYNLHPDNDTPLSALARIYPGMSVNKGHIKLPWAGDIKILTANGASKDGGVESFVVFDESHLYNNPKLKEMYSTLTRNVQKRVDEGAWYLETTTMYATGEDSIAEQNYEYMEKLQEGDPDLVELNTMLFDHRYGEITEQDFWDPVKLLAALNDAYGEIATDNGGWKNIKRMLPSLYKPVGSDERNPQRYFLNVPGTQSGASWLQPAAYSAVTKPIGLEDIKEGEAITLGFDGAINRDACVLMGCRISDGHIFLIHKEEKPDVPGIEYKVDTEKFDERVEWAFSKFRVKGFFADPAYWREYTDRWEKKHYWQLQVQATAKYFVAFDMSLTGMVARSLNRLYTDIMNGKASITDHKFVKRQFLNAITEERSNGQVMVKKPTPASTKTIDSVYAGMLAYEARNRLLGLVNEYEKPAPPARARKAVQLR